VNSLDLDVLRTALAWIGQGHRVTLGTVVRTWGSSPRPPGSIMALRDDGQVAGSVSGGCIEDDLIYRLRHADPAFMKAGLTTYGEQAEEAQRFGLPCGGTVQVVLEPLDSASWLGELLEAIESRRGVERRLDLETGTVTLAPSAEDDRVEFDGRRLRSVHGPRHRLLVIGAGQLSRNVASMAVLLDYDVTVCDPRAEYHEGWQALAGVTLSTSMPDDLVMAMRPGPQDAVVALTHDPKLDDLALMEALRSAAFYVGALGSKRTNASRRERLLEFDVTPEQIARLRGPIGLSIGARTPAEIAVSIVAEMTALRRAALQPAAPVERSG
jgi:xanthine dehydrogenase accessory factor